MYDMFEFVICCGGESTRNYPQSKGLPHKALLPFGDKRIIDYTLEHIVQIGGKHVTIVCSNQTVVEAMQYALRTDRQTEEKLRQKGKGQIADVLASTFLPDDMDIKYIVQPEPLGTAHVLACVAPILNGRHVVLIFPDDIIWTQKGATPYLKRIMDEFMKNPKRALLAGVEKQDARDYGILVNNRLVEKSPTPANNFAVYTPIIMCQEMIEFLLKQQDEKIAWARKTHKEWLYVDVINDFLDVYESNGFKVEMLMIGPEDSLLDTGNLALYEQCLLRMLLTESVFVKENQEVVNSLR
ncbi:MAG: NTP transferase domain-containing protein [Alphaproteobacteria bacterium]|nr:NTP transferase domain-containing protein [Alphaproteobacteria bacterium]